MTKVISQVVTTIRQALIPRWPNQKEVVWAIRIIVGLGLFIAIVVSILAWASNSGFVTQNNAAVVAALFALAGVLIAQIVNASLARSTQLHQQQLEDRRTRAAALEAYLDQMGNLLIDKKLQESEPDTSVRTVAQAQTLSILEWSDPIRRRILLQFLYTSNLIQGDNPTIRLELANLQEANLEGTNLVGANLALANLKGANLEGANLEGANLEGANLFRANLEGANLFRANLEGAHLIWANLEGAKLFGANLEGAYLLRANLKGAYLKGAKNLIQEQIQKANGDENTQLPAHIQRPDHWLKPAKEQ